MRQCHSGVENNKATWGKVITVSHRNMASTCSGWLSILSELPWYHSRLQRVQIDRVDWRKCIETYDTEQTLFYSMLIHLM